MKGNSMKRVCIIGISGKLGRYVTEHALARGHEATGVCRPESTG
jgi:putative NADH-flavin reductase